MLNINSVLKNNKCKEGKLDKQRCTDIIIIVPIIFKFWSPACIILYIHIIKILLATYYCRSLQQAKGTKNETALDITRYELFMAGTTRGFGK